MNLSLISSFVIGTIILLSLVKVNLSLVKNSMDSMNDQLAKVNINNVSTVVSNDFRKMGYGISGSSLMEATPLKITFKGDLEDDGAVDQITWELDKSQAVSETPNPDDFVLIRTVNGNSIPIKMGVTKFNLNYFDENNQPTAILDEVRRVEVKLICESTEPVDGRYRSAAWEKTFAPLSIAK